MSEDKLNLDEREEEDIFDEADTSNDSEGNEYDDSSVGLEEYNKRTGKTFKSWDDVVKSTKEADKLFAQGKHKEVPEKRETQSSDDLVEMFYEQNPQAELVKDKLERFAQIHGSVIKAWRNEPLLKEMASKIAQEQETQNNNLSKVEKPGVGKSSSFSFSNVDLTNKEHVKWLNSKSGRRAEYTKWFLSQK